MNKRQQKKLKRAIALKIEKFSLGRWIHNSVFTGREMAEIKRLKQSRLDKFEYQLKTFIGKEELK